MTINRQAVRCVAGSVFIAIFLGFLAISICRHNPADDRGNLTVATLEANTTEAVAYRHSANPGLTPGLCLKAAGPCILVALFEVIPVKRSINHESALKVNLPRHNPFYVFVTTNAP